MNSSTPSNKEFNAAMLRLPPEVRKAWGLTSPGRRGPRPELGLDRIVEAAMRIADAQGLAQVSMARVADELGFTTMSLYRHVSSKEELLVHMQDASFGAAPHRLTDGTEWRAGLAIWTRELLGVYLSHRWSLEIPITAPPLMPRNIEWMDCAFAIMEPLRLRSAEKLSAMLLLSGYARNEATLAISMESHEAQNEADDDGRMYEQGLRLLVRADRLPALHRVIAEIGLFDGAPQTESGPSDEFFFDFGLARILDGIEVLVERGG